jgi:predicted transcriptional regulator
VRLDGVFAIAASFEGIALPPGARKLATDPQPVAHASVEGSARSLSVNGVALRVADLAPVAAPPTWIQLALGALLLAWSMLRGVPAAFPLQIDDPLANERRRRVYDELVRQRIVHLRALQREVRMPVGIVVYHLDVLCRAGIVGTLRMGRHRVYFLRGPELTKGAIDRLALLADPTRRDIARLVMLGRSTQASLRAALDLDRGTVSRQLAKLEKAGLVDRSGKPAQYAATELLRTWFAR